MKPWVLYVTAEWQDMQTTCLKNASQPPASTEAPFRALAVLDFQCLDLGKPRAENRALVTQHATAWRSHSRLLRKRLVATSSFSSDSIQKASQWVMLPNNLLTELNKSNCNCPFFIFLVRNCMLTFCLVGHSSLLFTSNKAGLPYSEIRLGGTPAIKRQQDNKGNLSFEISTNLAAPHDA